MTNLQKILWVVLGITILVCVGEGIYYFSTRAPPKEPKSIISETTPIPSKSLAVIKEVRGIIKSQSGDVWTMEVLSAHGTENVKKGDTILLTINESTHYYTTDGTNNWATKREGVKLNDEAMVTILENGQDLTVQELRIIKKKE